MVSVVLLTVGFMYLLWRRPYLSAIEEADARVWSFEGKGTL
jgi:hypothetical protein